MASSSAPPRETRQAAAAGEAAPAGQPTRPLLPVPPSVPDDPVEVDPEVGEIVTLGRATVFPTVRSP